MNHCSYCTKKECHCFIDFIMLSSHLHSTLPSASRRQKWFCLAKSELVYMYKCLGECFYVLIVFYSRNCQRCLSVSNKLKQHSIFWMQRFVCVQTLSSNSDSLLHTWTSFLFIAWIEEISFHNDLKELMQTVHTANSHFACLATSIV